MTTDDSAAEQDPFTGRDAEFAIAAPEFHPGRWGAPEQQMVLSDSVLGALSFLGITAPAPPPAALETIDVPPTVDNRILTALAEIVGAEHVLTSREARLGHTRGYSTPDLLKLRSGDASDAPQVVVTPATGDEVQALIALCVREHLALSPYSGGTAVSGGLAVARAGFTGVLSVDLSRLSGLTALDPVSQIATFAAGTRLPEAEKLLAAHGLSLGHFPQSYEGATVGGCAVTRSAGQSSIGYGRFDDMIVGLTVVTPAGTITAGTAPKSAAGPDLRQLLLGSEGIFGICTEVRVRVHPLPTTRIFGGWHFPSFDAGAAAARTIAQGAVRPTVLRLSDEVETALNLADPQSAGAAQTPAGGCLLILGIEGDKADVELRQHYLEALLRQLGGVDLGPEVGEQWRTGRFRGPYLRDPLLDAGALVETLETVTFWSNIDTLKAAVTTALTSTLGALGTNPVVMCHISHVYPTGASLYFTVIAAATADPLAQWAAAKTAANDAIRAAGASITHHHAVGRDHREVYHQEVGPVALEVLRAVKRQLDPTGVCNPGVLV